MSSQREGDCDRSISSSGAHPIEHRRVDTGKLIERIMCMNIGHIILFSFPPPGTHWVVEIANLIFANGNVDEVNRAQQSYPVEFEPSQPGRPKHRIMSPIPQYKAMTEWKAPRVTMTHLPEEMMPSQIYQGKGKASHKIVCYYRELILLIKQGDACPLLAGGVAFRFPGNDAFSDNISRQGKGKSFIM